uniref:Uncharacterized protein n=1 Tax=Brassica oleracea TaxID=3712 RepID=A0A3P6CMB5_BRAOL|nr:unnamed protein product [Brassica oleracea]
MGSPQVIRYSSIPILSYSIHFILLQHKLQSLRISV